MHTLQAQAKEVRKAIETDIVFPSYCSSVLDPDTLNTAVEVWHCSLRNQAWPHGPEAVWFFAKQSCSAETQAAYLEDAGDVCVVVLMLFLVELLQGVGIVCLAVLCHLVTDLGLLPGLGQKREPPVYT
jgi:hypothetical protein